MSSKIDKMQLEEREKAAAALKAALDLQLQERDELLDEAAHLSSEVELLGKEFLKKKKDGGEYRATEMSALLGSVESTSMQSMSVLSAALESIEKLQKSENADGNLGSTKAPGGAGGFNEQGDTGDDDDTSEFEDVDVLDAEQVNGAVQHFMEQKIDELKALMKKGKRKYNDAVMAQMAPSSDDDAENTADTLSLDMIPMLQAKVQFLRTELDQANLMASSIQKSWSRDKSDFNATLRAKDDEMNLMSRKLIVAETRKRLQHQAERDESFLSNVVSRVEFEEVEAKLNDVETRNKELERDCRQQAETITRLERDLADAQRKASESARAQKDAEKALEKEIKKMETFEDRLAKAKEDGEKALQEERERNDEKLRAQREAADEKMSEMNAKISEINAANKKIRDLEKDLKNATGGSAAKEGGAVQAWEGAISPEEAEKLKVDAEKAKAEALALQARVQGLEEGNASLQEELQQTLADLEELESKSGMKSSRPASRATSSKSPSRAPTREGQPTEESEADAETEVVRSSVSVALDEDQDRVYYLQRVAKAAQKVAEQQSYALEKLMGKFNERLDGTSKRLAEMQEKAGNLADSYRGQFAASEIPLNDEGHNADGTVKLQKAPPLSKEEAAELKTELTSGKLQGIGQVQKENFARLQGTGLATQDMVLLTMKEYHMKYDAFSEKKVSPFLRMEADRMCSKIAQSCTIQELAMFRHKTNELLLKISGFDAMRTVKYLRDGGLFKDILVGHRDVLDKIIRAAGGWKMAVDIAKDECDYNADTYFYPEHVRIQILEFYRKSLQNHLAESRQINEDYAHGHDRVDILIDKAHYRADEAEHRALHATRLQHAAEAKQRYLEERVSLLEEFVRDHPDVNENSIPAVREGPAVDDAPAPAFQRAAPTEKKISAAEITAAAAKERRELVEKEKQKQKAEEERKLKEATEFAPGFDVEAMAAEDEAREAAAAASASEETVGITKFSPVLRSRPGTRPSTSEISADTDDVPVVHLTGARVPSPGYPVESDVRATSPSIVVPAAAAVLSAATPPSAIGVMSTADAVMQAMVPTEDMGTQMSRPGSSAVGPTAAVPMVEGSTQWSRPGSDAGEVSMAMVPAASLMDNSTQWSRPDTGASQGAGTQPPSLQVAQPMLEQVDQGSAKSAVAVQEAAEAETSRLRLELSQQMKAMEAQKATMRAEMEAQLRAQAAEAEMVASSAGKPQSPAEKAMLRHELEAELAAKFEKELKEQVNARLEQEMAQKMTLMQQQQQTVLAATQARMKEELQRKQAEMEKTKAKMGKMKTPGSRSASRGGASPSPKPIAAAAAAPAPALAPVDSATKSNNQTDEFPAPLAIAEPGVPVDSSHYVSDEDEDKEIVMTEQDAQEYAAAVEAMAQHQKELEMHEASMRQEMENMRLQMEQQQLQLQEQLQAEQQRKMHEMQLMQHEKEIADRAMEMEKEMEAMRAHEAQMAEHETQMAADMNKLAADRAFKESEIERLRLEHEAMLVAIKEQAAREATEHGRADAESHEKMTQAQAAYDSKIKEMEAEMAAQQQAMAAQVRAQEEEKQRLQEELAAKQQESRYRAMELQEKASRAKQLETERAELIERQQQQQRMQRIQDQQQRVQVQVMQMQHQDQTQQQAKQMQQQMQMMQMQHQVAIAQAAAGSPPQLVAGEGNSNGDGSYVSDLNVGVMVPPVAAMPPAHIVLPTTQVAAMTSSASSRGLSAISALSSEAVNPSPLVSSNPSRQFIASGDSGMGGISLPSSDTPINMGTPDPLPGGLGESVPNRAALNQQKLVAMYMNVEQIGQGQGQTSQQQLRAPVSSFHRPPLSGEGWVVVQPQEDAFPRPTTNTSSQPNSVSSKFSVTPPSRGGVPASIATSQDLVDIANMSLAEFKEADSSPSNVQRFTHEGPMYDIDPVDGKPRTAPVSVRLSPKHMHEPDPRLAEEIEEALQAAREPPKTFFQDDAFTDYLFGSTSLGIVSSTPEDRELHDEGTQTECDGDDEVVGASKTTAAQVEGTLGVNDRVKTKGSGVQLVRMMHGEFEVCEGIFYAIDAMQDLQKSKTRLPHNTILCRRDEGAVTSMGVRDVPHWMPLPPLPEDVEAFIVPQLLRLAPGLSWVTKPTMGPGLRLPHDILAMVVDGDVVLPTGLEFVKMAEDCVLDGRCTLPPNTKLLRSDNPGVLLSAGLVLPGGVRVLNHHDYFDLPILPEGIFLADTKSNAELPYGFSAVQTTVQLDKEAVTRKQLCSGVCIVRKPHGIRLLPGQEIIRRPKNIPLPHGMLPSTKAEVSLELEQWMAPRGYESVQLTPLYDFLPGATITRGISMFARPFGLSLPANVFLIRRDSNASLPPGWIMAPLPFLPAGMMLPRNVQAVRMLPNAHIPKDADLSGLKGSVAPDGTILDGMIVLDPAEYGIRPGHAVIYYTFKGSLPVVYERVPRAELPQDLRLPASTTVVRLVPRFELPHGVQLETGACLGKGVQLGPGTLLGRGTRVLPRPPGLMLDPGQEIVHVDRGIGGGLLPMGVKRLDPPPQKHSVWLAPDVICIQLPSIVALPSARELGSMLNVVTVPAERNLKLPEDVILVSRSRAHYDIHHAASEKAPLPAGMTEIPLDVLESEAEANKVPFGSFLVRVAGRFEFPIGTELLPGMTVLRRPADMVLPSGVEFVKLAGGCILSPTMTVASCTNFSFSPRPGTALVRVPPGLQPFSWGTQAARGVESVANGGGLLLPENCFLVDRPQLPKLPSGLRDFLTSHPEATRALPRNMPPMLEAVELVPQYELPESIGHGMRGGLREGIHLAPGQQLSDGVRVGARPAGAKPPAGVELLIFNKTEPRFTTLERRTLALSKLGLRPLNTATLGDLEALGGESFFDTPPGCAWVHVDKFSLGAVARLTKASDLGDKKRKDVANGICTPILTLPSLHNKDLLDAEERRPASRAKTPASRGGGGGGSSLADQELIHGLLNKVEELELELEGSLKERDKEREVVRSLKKEAAKKQSEYDDMKTTVDKVEEAETEARTTIWGLKAQLSKAETRAKLKLTDYVKEKTKNKWTSSTQKGKIASLTRQLKQWKEIHAGEEGGEGGQKGGNGKGGVSEERLMQVSRDTKYAEAAKYRGIIEGLVSNLHAAMVQVMYMQNSQSIPDSAAANAAKLAAAGHFNDDLSVGSASQFTIGTSASSAAPASPFAPLLKEAADANKDIRQLGESAGIQTVMSRLQAAHSSIQTALSVATETDRELAIEEQGTEKKSKEAALSQQDVERFDSGIPLQKWADSSLDSLVECTREATMRSHRALSLAELEVKAQQDQRRKLIALCQRTLASLSEYKAAAVHARPEQLGPTLDALNKTKEELVHWRGRAGLGTVESLTNLGAKYRDLKEIEKTHRLGALVLRSAARKDEQHMTLTLDIDPKEAAAIRHLVASRLERAKRFDDRAEVVGTEADALVALIHSEIEQLELNVRSTLPAALLAKVLRIEPASGKTSPMVSTSTSTVKHQQASAAVPPLLHLSPQKTSLALGSRLPPTPGSPLLVGRTAWPEQDVHERDGDASIASAVRALSPQSSITGDQRRRLRPLRSGIASSELGLDIRDAKEHGLGDGIYSADGSVLSGVESSFNPYGRGDHSYSQVSAGQNDDVGSVGGDSVSSMGSLGTYMTGFSGAAGTGKGAAGFKRGLTNSHDKTRTLRSNNVQNDESYVSFSSSMGLSSHTLGKSSRNGGKKT